MADSSYDLAIRAVPSIEDGTLAFYGVVNALLQPGATVLDFGAGRGAGAADPVPERRALSTLRGTAHRVIGVDIDPVVLKNPLLDEALVAPPGGKLPLGDASVDLVVADFVFEHLTDPHVVAAELARVTRPGGWLCARTPNRWGYPAVGSRVIPHRLHGAVLRRLQPSRTFDDVFPTVYRLNTKAALHRHFPPLLWDLNVVAHNPQPAYAGRSAVLYSILGAVHRVVPDGLAVSLFAFARRL